MECPICYESFTLIYMIVPSCKHAYCRSCLFKLSPNCAMCRRKIEGSYIIRELNASDEILSYVELLLLF